MSLNILKEIRDRDRLSCYIPILEYFSNECNNDKTLNSSQKLNLDKYICRSKKYCETGKQVRYERAKWKLDKNVLSTKEQIKTYKKFFKLTNNIIREVHSDPFLSLKCKRALCSYLGCVHCHIRGKLNRKID